MVYDPQKHHRRSIRLKGYDFTVMPNHTHGNILIEKTGLNANQHPIILGNMVGAFNSISFPNGTKVAWFKDIDGNLLSLSQTDA